MKTYPLPSLLIFGVCFLSLACVTTTPLDNWIFLGERTVDHRVERDEIRLSVRDGTFRRIKLKVIRSGITFRAVRVHYANGGVEHIDLRNAIPAGGETRAIDLNGQNRVIEKVVFFYNTRRVRGDKAVVQLYGFH